MVTVAASPQRAALIYCRVSSDKQEDNSSLGTQEAACREFCERNGYAIGGVFTEVFTASALWERPQLTAERDAIRRGEAKVIVAFSIDRLSRDAAHLHILVDEAERHGGAIEFATEALDSSPIGKVLLSLKGFAAEVEREKIIERTMRGLRARAEAGKLKPGRHPLYGYKFPVALTENNGDLVSTVTRDRYEIEPETAPIVRRIFAQYVEGTPLTAICARLNAEGIPAPGGGTWTRAGAHSLLRSESYTGTAFLNRTRTTKERGRRKQIPLPREEWIRLPDGTIPPLIDRATYDAATARSRRNAQESTRRNSNPEAYLLRGGYAVCGNCGKSASASFRTRRDGSRVRGYRVIVSTEQHVNCRSVAIDADVLDSAVETYLKHVVLDRDVLALMIGRLRDDDTATTDTTATEATLAKVKKRQTIVANAVAALNDFDAAAPLLIKLNGLAAERRTLETELAQLRTRADAATATLARLDTLQAQAERIAANWHLLPYAGKRDLITATDLRAVLYPATAIDRYVIESDADALLDAIALDSPATHTTWPAAGSRPCSPTPRPPRSAPRRYGSPSRRAHSRTAPRRSSSRPPRSSRPSANRGCSHRRPAGSRRRTVSQGRGLF